MATFLEKASCIPGQVYTYAYIKSMYISIVPPHFSPNPNTQSRTAPHLLTVHCSWLPIYDGTCYTWKKSNVALVQLIHFTFDLFFRLPAAVLHALFTSLAGKFPLNSSPAKDVSMDTLCAHTLYSLWVVHCLSLKDTHPSFRGYQWEGQCSNLDTIKDAVSDIITC